MTARIELPSLNYLRECFIYKRRLGKLYWKHRPLDHFVSVRGWRRWNTRYAGKEALCSIDKKGYAHGAINKQLYFTHRIIWKMHTGREPPSMIDHRDRNKSNNRFRNFRPATNGQNRANSSKAAGVHFRRGKWHPYVRENGRHKNLGCYVSKEEALAVRKKEMVRLYGEFAL